MEQSFGTCWEQIENTNGSHNGEVPLSHPRIAILLHKSQ